MSAEKLGEVGWIDRLVNWEGDLPLELIRHDATFVVDDGIVKRLMRDMLAERVIGGKRIPAGQTDSIIVVQLDCQEKIYDVAQGIHRVIVRESLNGIFPDSPYWPPVIKAKIISGLEPELAFEVLWQLRGQGVAEHPRVALPRIIQFAESTWRLNPLSSKVDFITVLTYVAGLRTGLPGLEKAELAEVDRIFGNVDLNGLWGQAPTTVIDFLKAAKDVDPKLVVRARPSKRLAVDIRHPERSEIPNFLVPLLAFNFPGSENFALQQAIAQLVVTLKLAEPQAEKTCMLALSLLKERTSDEVVRIIGKWSVQDISNRPKREYRKKQDRDKGPDPRLEQREVEVLRKALARMLLINYRLLEVGSGGKPSKELLDQIRRVLDDLEANLDKDK
jgi:hypothetical protein